MKSKTNNLFLTSSILTILILILVIISIFMYTLNPESLGVLDKPLEVKEMYFSPAINYNTNYFNIIYPEGGHIIPGYRNGKVWGFIIIGNGKYNLNIGEAQQRLIDEKYLSGTVTNLFVQLHPSGYETLRDSILVEQSFNTQILKEAEEAFYFAGRELRGYEVFDNRRIFLPSYGEIYALLTTDDYSYIRVHQSTESFIDINGARVNIDSEKNIYNTINPSIIPSIGFYLIAFIVVCLLIILLTVDIKTIYFAKSQSHEMPKEIGYLCFYLILFLIVDHLFFYSYLVLAGVILISAFYYKVSWDKLGISLKNIPRSIIISIVISLIIMSISKLIFPTNFIKPPNAMLLWGVKMFFLYYMPKEIFLRGYIQGTLERVMSPIFSLVITPLIAGLLWIIPSLFYSQVNWSLLLRGFLYIPMAEFIYSFIYFRLRNNSAAALTQTFLALLRSFFIY